MCSLKYMYVEKKLQLHVNITIANEHSYTFTTHQYNEVVLCIFQNVYKHRYMSHISKSSSDLKEGNGNRLTTSQGCPVGDKTNVRTVGERGPVALDDFVFIDEMAHFDRERIPERVVHAKGAGNY